MAISLMITRGKQGNPISREWIIGLNIAAYLGTMLALQLSYL